VPPAPETLDGLDCAAILTWLQERDEAALDALWARADEVRRAHVGDAVHLRGLIEISNYCVRHCAYCGIAACAGPLPRYRMTRDEILACARKGRDLGFGTIVLQGGEDPDLTGPFVADVVRGITRETGAAVTLSLGERSDADLRAWRDAGANRYLLRFETTDPELYRRIHPDPPGTVSDRLAQLVRMREMGYEIGTGVMVGIPGQTWDSLANDIWTFRDYDMDMIGIGPYLPSPRTPLAGIFPAADRLDLFAFTLGQAISHEIERLFAGDFALGAVLDAVASLAADNAGRVAEGWLESQPAAVAAGSRRAFLYSPGYCGWHISGQETLFAALRPEAIGIRLNESFLMTPLKSISGVLVLAPAASHRIAATYPFCAQCQSPACRERIPVETVP